MNAYLNLKKEEEEVEISITADSLMTTLIMLNLLSQYCIASYFSSEFKDMIGLEPC